MTESLRAQRMAHNEAAFREYNSHVLRGIEETNRIAKEENYPPIVMDKDMLLQFICECADEACKARIPLSLDEYE